MFISFINIIFYLYLNLIITVPIEYMDIERFFENNEDSIHKIIYNKINYNFEDFNKYIFTIIENKKTPYYSNLNKLTICFDNIINISYDEFKIIVYKTMKAIDNKSLKNIKDKKTENIIKNIYDAAKNLKATQNQLLVFTAIALSSNNCFFEFQSHDNKDNSNYHEFLDLPFGLLKITYSEYFNNESYHRKEIDLTDMFEKNTIFNEFKFFQKYLYKEKDKKSVSAYNCYINTLLEINSKEIEILSYDCIKKLLKTKINKDDKKQYVDFLNKIERKYLIFKNLLIFSTNIKQSTKY